MESREEKTERLEILRNAMIRKHLTDIDFNSEDERAAAYEKLLFITIKSWEFDDIFLSKHLDGLEDSKLSEVLALAKTHSSLCFYRGDMDYWLDSVEGVTNSEPDTVVAELLSNYNYLIRLAKNGGWDVLHFLDKFKDNELFERNSVIALLLLKFHDEDTLETILIDMAKKDGNYSDFTDTQKIILCDSPEGVLYREENGKIVIFSKEELKKAIVGDEDFPINMIDSKEFSEIVGELYYKYNGTSHVV